MLGYFVLLHNKGGGGSKSGNFDYITLQGTLTLMSVFIEKHRKCGEKQGDTISETEKKNYSWNSGRSARPRKPCPVNQRSITARHN